MAEKSVADVHLGMQSLFETLHANQECIFGCSHNLLVQIPDKNKKRKLAKITAGRLMEFSQTSKQLGDGLSEFLEPFWEDDNNIELITNPIFYHQNCGRNYISQRTNASPNKKLRLSSKNGEAEESALRCVYCQKEKLDDKVYQIKYTDNQWNSSFIVTEFRKRLTNHGAINKIEFNPDGNPVNKTGLHNKCRLVMMREILKHDKRESKPCPAKVREEIHMMNFQPLFHFIDVEVLEKSSAVLLRHLKIIAEELGIEGCGKTIKKYITKRFGERVTILPHPNPIKGVMVIDSSLTQQVLVEKYVLNEDLKRMLVGAGVNTVDI